MEQLKFLNRSEQFILDWTGFILMGIGSIGLIFTILFDRIAGRIVMDFGWVQVSGVIFSLSLLIFGVCVEKYLQEIKLILRDYIEK